MEIILNKTFCRSLTGALSKKDGFCIRKRGNRFFGCRKRNHQTMPEEHWLFIVTCAKMVLATHRVAATTNIGKCNRIYLRGLNSVTRSTPFSAAEIAHHARFTAVAQAVAARRKDLTKISADNAAFKAQKDTPNGKKTMRAYLWSLEQAEYDANNG